MYKSFREKTLNIVNGIKEKQTWKTILHSWVWRFKFVYDSIQWGFLEMKWNYSQKSHCNHYACVLLDIMQNTSSFSWLPMELR